MTNRSEDVELLRLRFDNLIAMIPAEAPCRDCLVGWLKTVNFTARLLLMIEALAARLERHGDEIGDDSRAVIEGFDMLREIASESETAVMDSLK